MMLALIYVHKDLFTNVDASKNAEHFHCKIDDVLIFLPVQSSVKDFSMLCLKKTAPISFNSHVFFGRSNSSVKFWEKNYNLFRLFAPNFPCVLLGIGCTQVEK